MNDESVASMPRLGSRVCLEGRREEKKDKEEVRGKEPSPGPGLLYLPGFPAQEDLGLVQWPHVSPQPWMKGPGAEPEGQGLFLHLQGPAVAAGEDTDRRRGLLPH
jgi:hypothetical protein